MTPPRRHVEGEVQALRIRAAEAEQALRAILSDEVETLLVHGPAGTRVYSAEGTRNHHRALVEAMTEGAGTVNDRGVVLYCNPALGRLLDRPPERVMGSELREHVDPQELGGLGALLDGARRRTCRKELALQRRGGALIRVLLSLGPVAGEEHVLALVATDLTEQRQAQETLAAGKALLQRILSTVTEAICTFDRDGRTQFANEEAGRLFGFDPAGAVGRPFAALVPEPVRAALAEALAAGERGVGARELPVLRGGGTRRVVLSTGLLRDGAGVATGLVAAFSDVTDVHEAQVRLRDAQKMEAVGRLAGGVAHDFNNLLTVILSAVELLGADPAVEGAPGLRGEVEEIRAASARARDLTRGLLAFARRQVLLAAPHDLNALVAGSERLLRRLLAEDIEIELSLAPDLWTVRVDPVQVDQLLFNLAANARDAMSQGGRLVIATANVEAPIGAEAGAGAGGWVRLTVSDTGAGMSPEVLEHAFEPFFTTKPTGQGTGLGLATVYGIVKQSGGAIRVESEPGRGTRVEILLPRERGAAPPAGPAPVEPDPGAAPAAAPGRVLVVEDDPRVRRAATRALRGGGHEVLEAATGAAALAVLEAEGGAGRDVDLVLTDAVMPGMNGPELAAEVRRRWPAVRLLMVSGHAHDVLASRALGELPLELLAKPFTPGALRAAVARALRGEPPAPD